MSAALEAVEILRPTLERIGGWRLIEGRLRRPKEIAAPNVVSYDCPLEAASEALGGPSGATARVAASFLAIPPMVAVDIMNAADAAIPDDAPLRAALLKACSLRT